MNTANFITVSYLFNSSTLAVCEDGDLRLVGGLSKTEGRLEVCFNRRWGTIDGDGWTHTDTQVACSQLGYPTSSMSAIFMTKHQKIPDLIHSCFAHKNGENPLFTEPNSTSIHDTSGLLWF